MFFQFLRCFNAVRLQTINMLTFTHEFTSAVVGPMPAAYRKPRRSLDNETLENAYGEQ